MFGLAESRRSSRPTGLAPSATTTGIFTEVDTIEVEVREYFTSGVSDDEAGVWASYLLGRPQPRPRAQLLATTPTLVATLDAVIATVGFEAARDLVGRGAHVVSAVRDTAMGEKAAAGLRGARLGSAGPITWKHETRPRPSPSLLSRSLRSPPARHGRGWSRGAPGSEPGGTSRIQSLPGHGRSARP
jgi:hypothetical protein